MADRKGKKDRSTWRGRASISARRPSHGWSPDPMEATSPVLAMGQAYSIPSKSNSDLMSWLVSYSSKASSGFWWILLRTLLSQSKNSGFLADFSSSRVSVRSSDSVGVSKAHVRLVVNVDTNKKKYTQSIVNTSVDKSDVWMSAKLIMLNGYVILGY